MRFFEHVKQTALAFDCLVNATLLGGFAMEDISARAWRQRLDSRLWSAARIGIDAVFALFGQTEHCKNSYLAIIYREDLPTDYRSRL